MFLKVFNQKKVALLNRQTICAKVESKQDITFKCQIDAIENSTLQGMKWSLVTPARGFQGWSRLQERSKE